MVIGQAVHTILKNHDNPNMVRDYKRNLTRVRKELKKLKNTKILWLVNQRVEPKLMSYPLRSITNTLIKDLNTAAIQVLYVKYILFYFLLNIEVVIVKHIKTVKLSNFFILNT